MTKTPKLPKIGEQFQGGLYAGITTGKDGAPYALVLLTDKPGSELTWKKAVAWAKRLDADLPNRPESAMLFALLKDKFQPTWYWTNEEYASSSAWFCYFYYGYQGDVHKSAEGAAVAVRRLPLESFNPFKGPIATTQEQAAKLRAAGEAILKACDAVDAAAAEVVL